MATVAYSQELLTEFDKLVTDFGLFMSLNLIHADKNLGRDCQARMTELIRTSLGNGKHLADFFVQPLLQHEAQNKEKLLKNLSPTINFFYDYLLYAGPILQQCRPDIYAARFAQIKKHYTDFCQKYLS